MPLKGDGIRLPNRAANQSAKAVRIRTPAKINLILRVLDRRSDGYHNLWSLMQTVALEDELRVQVRSVVLVHPRLPIDTRWAYDRLAATREHVRPLSEQHRRLAGQASLAWQDVIPLKENDFEQPLVSVYDAIREMKARLLTKGAETALLSGSGATVFGIFCDEDSAFRAQASVEQVHGWRGYVGRAGTASLSCREESSDPLQVG